LADEVSLDRLLDEAKHAIEKGDFDAAIARLDRAVELAPNAAIYRGLRGVARLRKGQYAQGVADLEAAIRLNPDDAGQSYPPPAAKKVTDDALRRGRRQVEAMLRDRPTMAEYGAESEFLRAWAARKFAGEDLGGPIHWNPASPLHSDAEHLAANDDENAEILVEGLYSDGARKGQPRTFEELWAGAVYELHNVNFSGEFVRLNDAATEGRLSKRDFVAGILKYELQAAQQTRAFYVRVFLPWAEKQRLPTDPSLWFCDWWDTSETVLQSFSDPSAYPWRPYARIHDWGAVHRHWHREEFAKAIRLLQRMRTEEGYDEELEDIDYWIDRCKEEMDSQKGEE